MEQLSGEAVRALMQRAEALQAGASPVPKRHAPWARRESRVASPVSAASFLPAGACAGVEELLPAGLERRLVRRAEARWQSLRTSQVLPPARDAQVLLAPPFASRAMHIGFPDARTPSARISAVGEALHGICAIADGPVRADADRKAPLIERLVALAATAVAHGGPRHLDSDEDGPGDGAADGTAPILLRAVALPFAPDEQGRSSAIVILSWRKLLSQKETAALHQELAAAIAWMRDQGPKG